ncbi:MAG: hypothetical protein KDK70_18995, partial [Myxococcales bacterium]|nr:hypothetical protein [Myxococcales bacterium]
MSTPYVAGHDEALANLIGDLADHYEDVSRLGDGAEGGALAATERATRRRVVLKRVPAEQFRAVRFAFEVLRRAGSPHLPAPRALVTAGDGAGWMVTDWVAGAPLPVDAAADVAGALAEARAVAHALAAIHGAGTHHGDVAPSNVIVTPTGGVVLVDLGQLGRRGMGTPGFLAPEVLAGGGGPAADRFSLGCLLCLRLLGQVPWRRPEALMEVRDAAAVQARLEALGAARLEAPVRALLIRLLHPRPGHRIGDSQQLVAYLTRLHAAADAGLDLRQAEPWWRPARWPYRGPALGRVCQELRDHGAARLIAVAGPAGVGRGRVVEELVQSLQADPEAPPARICEARGLSLALGRAGVPWLEAWRSSSREGVVGLVEDPAWPPGLHGEHEAASTAAVLQEIASGSAATLVMPVPTALGEAIAARGGTVIEVHPWSVDDVAAVLDGVVDETRRSAWAARLHAATGGWPGRVLRAAEACAEAQLDDPQSLRVADAIAHAAREGSDSLHPGLARAVMLAVWRGGEALVALPAHFPDGERPWATVEAAARRRLGDGLAVLAADVAAVAERQAEALSLPLAIDAERPAAIEAHLRGGGELTHALGRWLDAGGAARLAPSIVAAVMRHRLGRGDVEGVVRLGEHAPCPEGALVLARALQRLGRTDDALAQAEQAQVSPEPAVAWSARGLVWRLWIDRGQGTRAL